MTQAQKETKMKKQIIFDMDGTLSDTAKATTGACNDVRAQFGLPEVSESDIRSVMGYADPEFFYRLYPDFPHEMLNEVRYKVNVLEDKKIEELGAQILFPGVDKLLSKLNSMGYSLYIASTGSTDHVHTTLKSANIEHLFKDVYCNEPVKVDMVKKIIGEHNKEDFLMVGDMHKDSDAAKANGIFALGAAFGYLTAEEYPLFDAILQTPSDLQNYL